MATSKKGKGERALIEPNGDKRYVRRNAKGQISESDDQGKSLGQDIRKTAKTKVKTGHGDEGDQKSETDTKNSRVNKKSAPAKKVVTTKKATVKKK